MINNLLGMAFVTDTLIPFLISTLEEGFLYGIMVLGVFITYKILDFPDLSVDGSFPLGAAVTAVCLIKGVDPFLTVAIAMLVGMLAGAVTGALHVVFKITNLMSGILVMTGLYSINLRIMGKSNLPLFGLDTVFNKTNDLFINGPEWLVKSQKLIIAAIFAIGIKLILDWYLSTKAGFALRATGDNPQLMTTLGVNIGIVKIIGVAVSNGVVAVSGSLVAQTQRFSDVNMGVGIVVTGLASIIIGTSLFKRLGFFKLTTAALVGGIIYKIVLGLALRTNLEPGDLRLISSILVILFLAINNRGKDFKELFVRKSRKGGERDAKNS